MKQNRDVPGPFAELRHRAEDWLGGSHANSSDSESDTHRLIHELHVHQIELEMQNEELELAQTELEESLARYTALYEFAPVGYLTLNPNGVLNRINLTGTRLLRIERASWVGRRLALLLPVEKRTAFDAFLAKAFESRTQQIHEIELLSERPDPPSVELTAIVTEDGQECSVMAVDITSHRRAERMRQELQLQLSQKVETLGALSGSVAHDLDNVLAGILNGLSLELERDKNGERQNEIEHLQALAKRGAELTNRLLEIATGAAGTP
jgi:PAS domain-containing protein